jgi:hypothetical protein
LGEKTGKSDPRLLILSREALLDTAGAAAGEGGGVLRRLAHLTRRGCHLLLIETAPDQWFPTRSSGDDLLTAQGRIREQIQEFGGNVDGTYYVSRHRFSEARNCLGALRDILERYHCEPSEAILLCSNGALRDAAVAVGMPTLEAPTGEASADELLRQVETLA